MIARTVVDVLRRGLVELRARPELFERHLRFLGMPTPYVAGWRQHFLEKPVSCELDYPIKSSRFPLLSVISSGSRDKDHFLGGSPDVADEGWGLQPGEADYGRGVLGGIDETTVKVVAWSTNTEAAFQLMLVARWLVTRDRDQLLLALGPVDTQEAELMLDETKLPTDGQFARMLTVSVIAIGAQIDDAGPVGPMGSRSLNGLFVDDGTEANETEGVRANVTTVVHDEA